MSTLPKPTGPGLWKVKWGTTSFTMNVFERDGALWCREINPAREHGNEPMQIRDDGGEWEKIFLCRVVRFVDKRVVVDGIVVRRKDAFEEYATGDTAEAATANLRARLDAAKFEVVRIDILRQ